MITIVGYDTIQSVTITCKAQCRGPDLPFSLPCNAFVFSKWVLNHLKSYWMWKFSYLIFSWQLDIASTWHISNAPSDDEGFQNERRNSFGNLFISRKSFHTYAICFYQFYSKVVKIYKTLQELQTRHCSCLDTSVITSFNSRVKYLSRQKHSCTCGP